MWRKSKQALTMSFQNLLAHQIGSKYVFHNYTNATKLDIFILSRRVWLFFVNLHHCEIKVFCALEVEAHIW